MVIDGSLSAASLPPNYFQSRGLTPIQKYRLERNTNAGLSSDYRRYDFCTVNQPFDDLQAQLCPSVVHCFTVASQRCYSIAVGAVEEVDWESDAITHLVLEENTKRRLKELVRMHQSAKEKVIKDIIPSKGKVRASGKPISPF